MTLTVTEILTELIIKAPRCLQRLAFLTPRLYSSNAALIADNMIQTYAPLILNHQLPWTCKHYSAPVINTVTGEFVTVHTAHSAECCVKELLA